LAFGFVCVVNSNLYLYIFWQSKIFAIGFTIRSFVGGKPSWQITKNVLFSGAKSFLVGSGLGTFSVDFSKFRTVDFNYDAYRLVIKI